MHSLRSAACYTSVCVRLCDGRPSILGFVGVCAGVCCACEREFLPIAQCWVSVSERALTADADWLGRNTDRCVGQVELSADSVELTGALQDLGVQAGSGSGLFTSRFGGSDAGLCCMFFCCCYV